MKTFARANSTKSSTATGCGVSPAGIVARSQMANPGFARFATTRAEPCLCPGAMSMEERFFLDGVALDTADKARGGFNAPPFGALHQTQAMVVSVFHFTHQIKVTSGSSHDEAILPAARPSLSASSGSHISTPPEGYDVSRLFHSQSLLDRRHGASGSMAIKMESVLFP